MIVRRSHTLFFVLASLIASTLACGPAGSNESPADSGAPSTDGAQSGPDAAPSADAALPDGGIAIAPGTGNPPIPNSGYVGSVGLEDFAIANYATYVVVNGKAKYWGYNIGGGIDTKPIDLPAPQGTTLVAISAGGHSNMALDATGHVWGAGGNIMGEMGIGTVGGTHQFYTSWVATPTDDQGKPFDHVVIIQEGFDGSSALKDDGTLWFWGLNGSDGIAATSPADNNGMTGITGMPTPTTGCPWGGDPAADPHCYTTRPHQIVFPKNPDQSAVVITKYSYGFNTPLALDQNGNVWTWGTFALVDGSFKVSVQPLKVTLPTKSGVKIVDVASAGDHWLALGSDGHLYGWAMNDGGAKLGIGDGKYTWTPTPNPIDLTAQPGFSALVGKIARIYSSGPASYLLDTSGSVWAWGSQVIGSVGSGPTGISQGIGIDSVNNWSWSDSVDMVMTPTKVLDDVAVFYARGYSYNAFAITKDGTLHAWGRDKFENLGDGCVGDDAPDNQPDICDVGTPKVVKPL